MKKILLLIALGCPAWAAFTFVNCQGATTTTSVSSLTTANWSSTAGDTVVCSVATFTQTLSTVVDANSKSFTVTAVKSSPAGSHQYAAYGFNIGANASYNVKATPNASSNEISITCAEFTPPAATTVSLDTSAPFSGSTTTPTGTFAGVTAGDLLIGAATADNNTVANSAGSGYTIPTNGQQPASMDTSAHQPAEIEYNLNATGGSTTVNFSAFQNGGWAEWALAFKAVANVASCSNYISLTGAGCK